MRRKATIAIPLEEGNRDGGKQFLLTELPADQAERWALRMLLAIAHAGGTLPDGALNGGMAGVAATVQGSLAVALRAMAGLRFEDTEPLLAIMFSCVQFQPVLESGELLPPQPIVVGANSQIEEVSTRMRLRWEVLQLHLNFSLSEYLSSTASARPLAPS